MAAIPCCSAFLAILGLFACHPQVIIVTTAQAPPPPTPTPSLLPYPDALDVVAVQQQVTWLINAVHIDQSLEPFQCDETLQELAERQAWKIVLGEKPFDHIDNWPATQLGEPVARLRACISEASRRLRASSRWSSGIGSALPTSPLRFSAAGSKSESALIGVAR